MPARKSSKQPTPQSPPDPRIRVNQLESNLALSIRQPYADEIMRGTKKIEYRSYPTYIRGRIYIYASKTPDDDNEVQLPLGVVIGSAEITDCTGEEGDYEWHLANPIRLKTPRQPTGRGQPSFFYAWDRP